MSSKWSFSALKIQSLKYLHHFSKIRARMEAVCGIHINVVVSYPDTCRPMLTVCCWLIGAKCGFKHLKIKTRERKVFFG